MTTALPVNPAWTAQERLHIMLAASSVLASVFEGCAQRGPDGRIYPYLDTLAKPPVWTRAYGRTYGISAQSEPITRAQAVAELREGLARYGLRVAALCPPITAVPVLWAAVTDWAWNCGLGAFEASRLRRALAEQRWADALEHLRTPTTAGGVTYLGLQRRRKAERLLAAHALGMELAA